MPITKDDITALRRAHRVSFHHRDGKSSITAVKECRDDGDVFHRNGEASRSMECRSRLQGSAFAMGGEVRSERNCFEMIHGAQYCHEWRTIAGLLRPDDEIELHWYEDAGTTQNHEEKRLHSDRLYLHIYRKDKKALSFLVDQSTCPDNSARMIRRA